MGVGWGCQANGPHVGRGIVLHGGGHELIKGMKSLWKIQLIAQ